ncbi:MAG: hypothetical protein JKY37_06320 [Nannocystaceae bacterium]|nr:hypothetical protein [Nannocystaceae bacterium]
MATTIFFSFVYNVDHEADYQPMVVVPFTHDTLLSIESLYNWDEPPPQVRLRVLGLEGQVRTRVDYEDRGYVMLYGIAGGVVWLDGGQQGIHTRAVDTLTVQDRFGPLLDTDPTLKRGYKVLGLADGGLAVRGKDHTIYLLTPGGGLRAVDKDTDGLEFQHRPGGVDKGSVRSQTTSLKHNNGWVTAGGLGKELVKPAFVDDWSSQSTVKIEDDFLLHSVNFEAPGNSAVLSRATAQAELMWSVSAQSMIGEIPFDEPAFSVVWAGWRSDGLWTLLSAHNALPLTEGLGGLSNMFFFVELDPATGKVLQRNEVRPPQDVAAGLAE